MNEKQQYLLALYLANDKRDREFRAAELERRVARRPGPSVRRSVGQSLVRLGERLAGETSLDPVRSR